MNKKKVLLAAVNAKYIHSNLALNSMRMYASEYADQVEIMEFTINQQKDQIIQEIYRKKPDILAFSCYIWNMEIISAVLDVLHRILPGTIIWLGGPEVSYNSETIMWMHPYVNGIMQGEGEKTFRALMDHYIAGTRELKDIPNIVYRVEKADEADNILADDEMSRFLNGSDFDGSVCKGRPMLPEDAVDMDELPFVYEDMTPFAGKIIYYETSRGCPFSCSYCMSSIEKGVRFRSLELVLRDLQYFLDNSVPLVKFVDRTFNASHKRAMEIWQYIIDHDNGVTTFHFEIEANVLTDDEVELFGKMRPGLIKMEIGVQSANKQTLEAVSRNPAFEKITRYAEQIVGYGNIHLHLDLIAGLPYEDYESFRNSFNTVYSLKPNELQLGFLKLLHGSKIRYEAEKWGIMACDTPPYEILWTKWLSYDDILRLKEVEEMLEVYFNSQQFKHTMEALAQHFPDPMSIYEALADYYRENGLNGLSHSRLKRFEILRSFILEETDMPKEKAEEYLTLDIYLRENAKSRPAWAENLAVYKEKMRLFYRNEADQHIYLPDLSGRDARQLQGMTHLEHFKYIFEEPVWMLFDYQQRSPVTDEARTLRIINLPCNEN